jgi:hypothetical protein
METYSKENEINEIEMQKDFDIKMILELKKIQFNLKNEGYLPTIDEAIARIASKWAKEDNEEETMESLMDDDSSTESFSSMMENDEDYI